MCMMTNMMSAQALEEDFISTLYLVTHWIATSGKKIMTIVANGEIKKI